MSPSKAEVEGSRHHRLPVEIYQKNVVQLARNELTIFARATQLFYALAIPHIYKNIYINPKHRFNPLSVTRRDVSHRFRSRLRVNASLPNPFDYTTHLTLAAHTSKICVRYAAVRMPDLKVLRVLPDPDKYPELTFCSPPDGVDTGLAYCSLVEQLAPPRVILGDGDTGFAGWVEGLWTASYRFPPETVRELVVHLGADDNIYDETFLDELPDTVHRMTLVLQRPNPQINREWRTTSATNFLSRVGAICATDARVVELVGFESIDKRWLRKSIGEAMKAVRGYMKYEYDDEELNQSDAQLDKKFERVKLMTREEYDLREPDLAKQTFFL